MDKAKLDDLLTQLRDGTIEAIEFGEPALPMGIMSAHRIIRIPTAGGMQFAFKNIHYGMLGSGIYIGNPSNEEIIAEAEVMIEKYMKPHPNPRIREFLDRKKDGRMKPEYFAIPLQYQVAV